MNFQVEITHHAQLRMSQRNVSFKQLQFILKHGQQTHCAGAILVTLRRKDIPQKFISQRECSCLEGTTIVLSRDLPIVLTIWRNKSKGLQHIRQKVRYSYA